MIIFLSSLNAIFLLLIGIFAAIDAYDRTRRFRTTITVLTILCIVIAIFKFYDDKKISHKSKQDSDKIAHLDSAIMVCDTINQRLQKESVSNALFQKAIKDSLHIIMDTLTGRPINTIYTNHFDKSKNVNIEDNHGIVPIDFR